MRKSIKYIAVILILILFLGSSCKEPELIFTITYNLGGGVNSALNVTTYTESSATIILADPSRYGYTFQGWFDNPTFTEPEVLNIPSGSTGNITLYASWGANTYEVTFNAQGGDDLSNASKDVIFASTYGELATVTFSDDGYEFGGWFTQSNGQGDRITETSVVGIGEDHTLYAYKAPIEYTITYHLGGGVNSEINPDVYTIESATINLEDPTKEGYSFIGWHDNEELTGSIIEQIPTSSTGNLDLYVDWDPNTYRITFESNGGTAAVPLQKDVVFNEEYGELATTTMEGYDFLGWYSADGITGELVETDTVMNTDHNHTLYARWEACSYTLTFNSTGGTDPDPSDKDVVFNEEYGELATTTKEGYTFDGWYSEIVGGTEIESDTIVSIASDDTVYAHWILVTYTITYNLDGGTNDGSNPATYTIETATITLEEATRAGYTFSDWYDNAEFSGTAITEITVGSTGNKTLYAKWTPIEYDITYELDSGTNDASNPATYTIETATITLEVPTKDGYTFVGWFDNAEFSGTSITQITVGSTGDRTLYAKWTPTIYSITYELNAGVNDEDNPATYTIETATITLEEATRTGYTFSGWFDNAEFSGTAITEITVGSTGNKTLYTKWTPIEYDITYELDSGTNDASNPATYTIETATITLEEPTKVGYTFNGWFDNAEFSGTSITQITVGSTGDRTLYAKWTPTIYSITYELNAGVNDEDNSATYTIETATITLEEPTKTGYTFSDWYDNAEFSGTAITQITVGSTGDRTLYAKWTPIEYDITYELDSGTNDASNPATYTIETATITLEEPTKVGYTFNGWFDNAEFSGTSITQITVGSTGDRTLYAKWTPTIYSITYELNAGVNDEDNPATYTIETATITLEEATRTGYTFSGWFDNAEFSGTAVTEITVGSTGNKTLYAKWTIITYTITYTLNGGVNSEDNPTEFSVLSDFDLENATRDYYDFNGWFDNAEFSGTAITQITVGSTGDRTLYAKWTPTIYSITYDLDGGTNHVSNPASYTVESSEIEFADPTRVGYYFAGWFDESSFETMRTTIPSGSHVPYTVYAKWNLAYSLRDIGPEGGTIFYNRTDYDYRTDNWHYLECGGFDVGDFAWMETIASPSYIDVVGTSTAIGTGRENSDLILVAAFIATNRNSAANGCDDYPEQDSGVWFLPSKDELDKLYKNLKLEGVGNFSATNYWSSSQSSETEAWSINFSTGISSMSGKGSTYRVRPIRRF